MPKAVNAARLKKEAYRKKLIGLFDQFKNVLVLNIDNVGSRQLQQIRIAHRGQAVFLMGKNTVIRRALTDELERNPKLANLIELVRGNVGFCFTNGDLSKIRKNIEENVVPAAASTGMLSPRDVYIPPGPTGLDPGQTAFFQAMNIATKISKGSIEVVNQVHLCKAGQKVSASAVALLTKLGIKPFFFGVKVKQVFEDGQIYGAEILDLSKDDMLTRFFRGVATLASVSLALEYPTAASVPHITARAFQKLLAIGLETGYIFEQAKIFKEMLDNPGAFASAAPAGGAAAGAAAAAAAPAAAAAEEEDDEEEEAGGGMDLFGGDEDAGEEAGY